MNIPKSGQKILTDLIVNIKSETVLVDRPVAKVFDFLTDFNNFEKLMPDQVVKWSSDKNSGRFTIKDMAEIGMRIEEVNEDQYVLITSDGKVPFEFKLRVNLEKVGEGQTAVEIDFDGQVGAMIAMMAKRPLTNLVNHMVDSIKQYA